MKKYEVLIQDKWNNLYQMGFYDTLDEASTFGPCFNTEVITPNDDIILVRGFILDWEKVINEESND